MLSAETTPSLSRSCGGSLAPVRDNYKNTDTEMAPQLTSVDGHSSPDATPKSEIMSSFQSAKDRLDRIKRQQGNGGGFNGDASENWRRSAERADFKMSNHENISHQRSLSDMAGGDIAPIGTVVPGPVWPSPEQLKVAYGYGIRRDDGSYTRLYRADELGGLDVTKIAITQGPEGLITLPPLEVDGHQQFVPRYLVSLLPQNRPIRPKIPAHPGAAIKDIDSVQKEIDTIVAKSTPNSAVAPATVKTPRRQKIYCDKWIHEGVCAFTQLGCKYKHEMPLDKATQLSLGLNHGLPSWYRRAQAVQLRPAAQGSPLSPILPRITGPWRRSDGSCGQGSHSTGLSLGSAISSSPPGQAVFHQSKFGPIAPPPQYLRPSTSNNPYSMLQESEDMKMEDDGEEITWSGRRR